MTSLVVNAAEAMSQREVRGTITVTGEECRLATANCGTRTPASTCSPAATSG